MRFIAGLGIGALVGLGTGWFLFQLAERQAAMPTPMAVSSPYAPDLQAFGQWNVSRSKSALTDETSVFASVDSAPYEGRYGQQTATLTVRCMEGQVGIVWIWGEIIALGKLRARLDKGEAEWISASVADSRDTAILEGEKAMSFIKRMLEADRMVAGYMPALDNLREVTFDLAGLRPVVWAVQDACKWE